MSDAEGTVRANKLLAFAHSGTIKLVVAGDHLRVAPPNSAGTNITPAAGWTTSVGTRRCVAMFGDTILASVSGGKLFESNGSAQATEISAAPDQSTCMIVTPSRQVMTLGCNEETSLSFNPRCIRWCDIENYSDWTSTNTNNAGEYILPGQADIVSGCIFGDCIVVWTEADMWLGQFVGDPTQTFAFTRVGDIGIAGLDAFAAYKNTLYWMAPDRGVYAYRVGATPQRIPCPISSEFPADASSNPHIFACALQHFGEIWFAVPVGATGPNRYYAYCADESAFSQTAVWFRGTFALGGITIAGAMIDSPLLVDSLADFQTTTIVHSYGSGAAEKPFRWDCAKTSTIAQLGMTGAYLQSADFSMEEGERRLMVRGIAPDFEIQAGAVTLTVQVRDRAMAEPVERGPFTLATSTSLAVCLVNDTIASGDGIVTVDTNPEAMAAGTAFTFSGVNGWEGGDTGQLKIFTVATDFVGGNGDIAFTPPAINSGPNRNVVSLPANNAIVRALTRASKKDFRASGRLFAFRFETAGPFRVRFGKPLFDVVEAGRR